MMLMATPLVGRVSAAVTLGKKAAKQYQTDAGEAGWECSKLRRELASTAVSGARGWQRRDGTKAGIAVSSRPHLLISV